MELLNILKWRYSAKRMNGETVPEPTVDKILEAIRLTPTSYGLQAFKVIVIQNPIIRENIFAAACPQPQIKECSHLLVLAAHKKITAEMVDEYIQLLAEVRGLKLEELSDFRSMFNGIIAADETKNFEWTSRQTYIALGIGLTAAAELGVDATPIEGFSPKKLDDLLHLSDQNLGSVSLLALGYRDEEKDFLAKAPKVRKAAGKLFELIS